VNEPTNKKAACARLVLQLDLGKVQNKCDYHEISLALVSGPLLHVPYKRKRMEYKAKKHTDNNLVFMHFN
jgi:hypothetical protein